VTQGEEILLAEQGVYLPQGRSTWQMGELCLTKERLLFLQPHGSIFDIPLTSITDVATERKRFVVVRKMAMNISYRDSHGRGLHKAWFITAMLGGWLDRLCQMVSSKTSGSMAEKQRSKEPENRGSKDHLVRTSTALRIRSKGDCAAEISRKDLERLTGKLDPGSREILWHLCLNKHATIDELAALISAPTHTHVLIKIRQGINPTAEEVLGRPALVFEESRFDQESGEIVTFSWWLAGTVALTPPWQEPEIDVFDEAREIKVIADLPGIEEHDIQVIAQRNKVLVRVDRAEGKYRKEVSLPAPVNADQAVTSFNNGVLVVHLKKIKWGKTMETAGRYVYCIMPNIVKEHWEAIGLDGQAVYAISYKDISALVHNCPLEPYQGDNETVKEWVWTHGEVIDAAWAEADTVLPMTFDCIIRPSAGQTAEETVVAWLKAEYDSFKAKLVELEGKVELGVQVFWLVDVVAKTTIEANKEIRNLRQQMETKPKGMAYFYQQKVEKALKRELEAKADGDYRRYYRWITPYAEDVHVNDVKRPAEGKQMLMNLSLLVRKGKVEQLGKELENIKKEEGIDIRFTGPWPPYSFVSKLIIPEEEESPRTIQNERDRITTQVS